MLGVMYVYELTVEQLVCLVLLYCLLYSDIRMVNTENMFFGAFNTTILARHAMLILYIPRIFTDDSSQCQ